MGDDLKKLRKILGWSQGELARKLGVKRQYIYHLEMGTSPIRPIHIQKLDHILQTEVFNQERMFDTGYEDVKRLMEDIRNGLGRKRSKAEIYI